MPKIQNEDVKSQAELTAASAPLSSLINDTKIYSTANGLNKPLDEVLKEGEFVKWTSADINYIKEGTFENTGADDDWTRYRDAAQSTPEDGTGTGGPNPPFSFGLNSPFKIDGNFSGWLISGSSADRQGSGISYDFTVGDGFKSSLFEISFMYKTKVDYQSGYFGVYVYDVDNAVLLNTTKTDIEKGPQSGSDPSGTLQFQSFFQIPSDSVNLRLIIHGQVSTTDDYELILDYLRVGPVRNSISGNLISDPDSSYVVDGTWTSNTTYASLVTRFGKFAKIDYEVSLSGAPNAASLVLDMPTGLAVDESMISIAGIDVPVGSGEAVDTGTNTHPLSVTYLYGNTTTGAFKVSYNNSSATAASLQDVDATNPFTFANTDLIKVSVFVPVKGWDTGLKPTSIVGQNPARVSGRGNAGTSITASTTDVDFTEVSDSRGSWSTNSFEAHKDMEVKISGMIYTTASTSDCSVDVYIDTAYITSIGNAAGSTRKIPFSGEIPIAQGETLTLRLSNSVTLSNDTNLHHITISENINSISYATPTDKVVLRVETGAGATVSSGAVIDFVTVKKDTQGQYSSGVYTISSNGDYVGGVLVRFTDNADSSISVQVDRGSGFSVEIQPRESSTTTDSLTAPILLQDLKVGDQVRVVNGSVSSRTLSTNAAQNVFFLRKV